MKSVLGSEQRRGWIVLFVSACLLVPVVALTVAPAPVRAQDNDNASNTDARPNETEARAFVKDLADRAIGILRRDGVTKAEQLRVFEDLLTQGFDLDFLARLALGRYRRQATPVQLEEYDRLFGKFILNKYSSVLGAYSGEQLVVTSTRAAGRRDIYVTTEIARGSDGARVDWRVRQYDDGLRIIDVVVENISMVISQREEFASVISREGFEGLLRRLRQQEMQVVEAMRG
ncbi:MAG: phospholipid-binding protein MlaC [Alphaproteobacteria bacterium]